MYCVGWRFIWGVERWGDRLPRGLSWMCSAPPSKCRRDNAFIYSPNDSNHIFTIHDSPLSKHDTYLPSCVTSSLNKLWKEIQQKIINLIPDKGLDSFGRTVTYPEVSRDFLQCPHRQMPKIASIRHKTNPLPSQSRQIHQSSYHSTLDSLSYLQRRQTNKQKAQLTPVGTKANKFQRFFTSLTKLFGSIS